MAHRPRLRTGRQPLRGQRWQQRGDPLQRHDRSADRHLCLRARTQLPLRSDLLEAAGEESHYPPPWHYARELIDYHWRTSSASSPKERKGCCAARENPRSIATCRLSRGITIVGDFFSQLRSL